MGQGHQKTIAGHTLDGKHLCYHRVWHLPFLLRPSWGICEANMQGLQLVQTQTVPSDPSQGKGFCNFESTRWLSSML